MAILSPFFAFEYSAHHRNQPSSEQFEKATQTQSFCPQFTQRLLCEKQYLFLRVTGMSDWNFQSEIDRMTALEVKSIR
jgi:hypothetical protein